MSQNLRIIVASKNPVKIKTARRGFAQVYPDAALDVQGVEVSSGVSDQPMTDRETLHGASNRAAHAKLLYPEADFWVGIEGGVEDHTDGMLVFAWIVVESADRNGRGRTGTFVLPEEVTALVRGGMELGHADDAVFDRNNSKQGNGSVGLLTRDLIDRIEFYVPALVLAMIPFMQPGLTFAQPKNDPQAMRERVRRGYDQIGAQYRDSRNQRDDDPDVILLEELVERLPQGGRVLDAGCGPGVPVTRFLSRHFDVTGVDFSEGQLKFARESVPDAQFIQADLTELDLPDDQFDAIVSYYAMIHIPREQHRAMLQKFYQMLKPGGWLLMSSGCSSNAEDFEADWFGADSMYWSHFDTATHQSLMIQCGFKLVWVRLIEDSLDGESGTHPFILAQKPSAS